MDARTLSVLEFDKIRERLAERTSFAAGRELALALEPSNSRAVVQRALQETTEARLLLELQPEFSVRRAHDVRAPAEHAGRGVTLEPEVLLDVRDTLESGAYVRSALAGVADRLPLLAATAQTIDPCPVVARAIKESIDDRGQILDTASPQLARIRSQLRAAYNRLMEALQRIVDAAAAQGVAQEPIITMRAGRYVIPIRAEARNQFRGIVHDASASGATVFMEPLAAVELNNEWRHLQIEEEKEIERVLRHLSGLVGQHADRIIAAVHALASIDLALAKAKYALALRAVEPALEEAYCFRLIQARHPLLVGDVVPIDVWLGTGPPPGQGETRGRGDAERGDESHGVAPAGSLAHARGDLVAGEATRGGGLDGGASEADAVSGASKKDVIALVITGPNTGGKTVALKTVGLLHLMAQAGLHIPAAPGSSVAVFDQIFADIGDEQSIEQSLSTFSSHMTNIVRILARADERSLVLLDELGAGTDPQEGSALARALLSHLVERGVRTIATTHYSELKAFAHQQPGIQNASVEFDVETLRPTYRLVIGLPGRSNALAIAQRLGLAAPILEQARALLAPSSMQIEQLLHAIQDEREAARQALEAAERARAEAERGRQALQRRLEQIEDERAAALEAAQREAEALLAEARERIRRAEHRVAAAGGDRLAVAQSAKEMQVAAQEIAARPVSRSQRAGAAEDDRPLGIGDRVEVRRLNAVGRVVSDPDERGEVEVQLGNLRTRAQVRELRRVTRREADERAGAGHLAPRAARPAEPPVRLPPARSVQMEIDVRGTRADDVVPRVERYLSDAFLAGMPYVRIIHGKGTGVLRQIIRDYLARSPMVHAYEPAGPMEGGEGATIAKLAV
jgi:DNA mismatch repair protein MutS2